MFIISNFSVFVSPKMILDLLFVPTCLFSQLIGFSHSLFVKLFDSRPARHGVLTYLLNDVSGSVYCLHSLLYPLFRHLLVLQFEFEHLHCLGPRFLNLLDRLLFLRLWRCEVTRHVSGTAGGGAVAEVAHAEAQW